MREIERERDELHLPVTVVLTVNDLQQNEMVFFFLIIMHAHFACHFISY